jgi:hypothetical protein
MIEDTPNTVTLTPSHYFALPLSCWRRNGTAWRQNETFHNILLPEVYWWLRENVGYELNENWDVDRYFYPDEERPDLPRGAKSAWVEAGRTCFYDMKPHMGDYSHNSNEKKIFFTRTKDARAFRERFQMWHDTWSMMMAAAHRRNIWNDSKTAGKVRDLTARPWGIASHFIRLGALFKPLEALGLVSYTCDHNVYGLRRFYFLDCEEDSMLFLLACQAEAAEVYIHK